MIHNPWDLLDYRTLHDTTSPRIVKRVTDRVSNSASSGSQERRLEKTQQERLLREDGSNRPQEHEPHHREHGTRQQVFLREKIRGDGKGATDNEGGETG